MSALALSLPLALPRVKPLLLYTFLFVSITADRFNSGRWCLHLQLSLIAGPGVTLCYRCITLLLVNSSAWASLSCRRNVMLVVALLTDARW